MSILKKLTRPDFIRWVNECRCRLCGGADMEIRLVFNLRNNEDIKISSRCEDCFKKDGEYPVVTVHMSLLDNEVVN